MRTLNEWLIFLIGNAAAVIMLIVAIRFTRFTYRPVNMMMPRNLLPLIAASVASNILCDFLTLSNFGEGFFTGVLVGVAVLLKGIQGKNT